MRESAADRGRKYIEMASASLRRIKIRKMPEEVTTAQVEYVLDLARGYVRDAKHYGEKRKPVTSLACIAYAEGLLDAIKFLELVEF